MADDPDAYVPSVDYDAIGPPDASYVPPGAPSVDAVKPPPAPGILSRAWQTLSNIPAEVWADVTRPSGDATMAPELKGTPIQPGPLMGGIAHGVREAIDWGAEKLARGGEAVLGPETAAALPGAKSAEQIRADMEQRRKDYEANPDNQADSTTAKVGHAIGAGLVLSGPIGVAGRAVGGVGRVGAALADRLGIPVLPNLIGRGLEYAGGGATAAPGAGLPGRLATRGASLATQGAGVGGASAAIQADPDKPFWPQVAQGAGEGAIAAPVVGAGLAAVTAPVRAGLGLLPGMVREDVAPLAERFITQHGIQLDPTQITQNPTYKIMADQGGKLPFSGAADRIAQARLQWQGAAAREMGEQTDHGVTHAVMDNAQTRIRAGMDRITNGAVIQRGTLNQDLTNIALDMPRFGVTQAQRTQIGAQFQNVLDAFAQGNGQSITGRAYQNLTQRGGPLDSAIGSNDPTVSAFALRIRNALDDALANSVSPAERQALGTLRYQYRVMKTLEPLVAQKGATGDIEPNGFLSRVREQSKRFDPSTGGIAYTGGGTLGDLAYGGQMFFGHQPDSGSAARAAVGALVGFGGHNVMHDPWGAAQNVAGVGGMLILNRGLQRLIRSPGVGANMIENTVRPPGPWAPRLAPSVVPGLLDYDNSSQR